MSNKLSTYLFRTYYIHRRNRKQSKKNLPDTPLYKDIRGLNYYLGEWEASRQPMKQFTRSHNSMLGICAIPKLGAKLGCCRHLLIWGILNDASFWIEWDNSWPLKLESHEAVPKIPNNSVCKEFNSDEMLAHYKYSAQQKISDPVVFRSV